MNQKQQMMNSTMLTNESGRSMVEMLGVLAIMGVIMYGAVAGINFGIDMYKINATYNEIEELSQSIIDLFSWSDNYGTLTVEVVCDNDAYPTCNQCETNGQCHRMTNQWGGDVTVGSSGPDGFVIQYTQIPDVACERLRTEVFQNVCVGNVTEANSKCDVTFYLKGSEAATSRCDSLVTGGS